MHPAPRGFNRVAPGVGVPFRSGECAHRPSRAVPVLGDEGRTARVPEWATNGPVVDFQIAEMTEERHVELRTWRYPPPYDFYDGDVDEPEDPERYFAALDADGELVGFYYFEQKPPDLDYGLGLRPDLTGHGLGLEFFQTGLAFARERYEPRNVFLHVAAFNVRARRVYERVGFRVISSHVRSFERFGDVAFLTMQDGPPGRGDPAPAIAARVVKG